MIQYIDESIFFRLFNISNQNHILGDWMVFITNASSTIFAVMYVALLIFLIVNKDRRIIPALLGPFFAYVLVYATRFIHHRPRPFMALDIESLIYHEASGSMPSMHATSALAIALAIYFIHKKFGVPAIGLAVLTGLSRVMVGVHFPLDIITGWLLSIMVLYGIYKIFYNRKNFKQTLFNSKAF